MGIWIDTPTWHPASTLKARGVSGVIRYLCMPYNTGPGSTMPNKRLERAELDEKIQAGIDVAVNWEDQDIDALGGYDRGFDKGRRSGDWMLNVLDWPAGGVCCSSIDFDVGTWDKSAPQAYQYGYRDGLTSEGPYHPGIYGDTQALDGAATDGTAAVFWWSVAKSWSSKVRPKTVHVDQNGLWQWDNSADLDTILLSPFGSYLHPLEDGDDVQLDPTDPIVVKILTALNLDVTHPGTVCLGDVWRMVQADNTDLTHGYTNASISKALGAQNQKIDALTDAVAALTELVTKPPSAGLSYGDTVTLTPPLEPQ